MPDPALLLALLATLLAVGALALALSERKRSASLRRRQRRLTARVGFLEALLRPAWEDRVRRDLDRDGVRPRLPVHCRAQHAEDILLYELFEGAREGFFIEVGAYDGFSHATTYLLESIGWSGLLVEALPERAEQARRCRPASHVVHAALGKRGSSGTTTLTRFADPEGTDELSSYIADIGGDAPRPSGEHAQSIQVPLTTMDALLDELGRDQAPVDLAVIDVEGGEIDLLDGFDLDRFRPRAILIEDHVGGDHSPNRMALVARGYADAGWISFNRLMVRKDEPELLLRARSLLYTTDSGRMPPEPVPSLA
ncbi:MAG: FkbM family methyltransferase [Phycisphaerales bacterium JB059]